MVFITSQLVYSFYSAFHWITSWSNWSCSRCYWTSVMFQSVSTPRALWCHPGTDKPVCHTAAGKKRRHKTIHSDYKDWTHGICWNQHRYGNNITPVDPKLQVKWRNHGTQLVSFSNEQKSFPRDFMLPACGGQLSCSCIYWPRLQQALEDSTNYFKAKWNMCWNVQTKPSTFNWRKHDWN